MEKYPKTRSPQGTFIAVENYRTDVVCGTLADWLDGKIYRGNILAVSLTKNPIKKWIRSHEFRTTRHVSERIRPGK